MSVHECRIAGDEASLAILRRLDASGEVAADHLLVADGGVWLALTDREIAKVREAGLPVEQGVRPPRPVASATDSAADNVQVSYVTDYLDGVQVAQRVARLAADFPALCQVITLPFPTTGYDGSLASAHGPATVTGLRITADPGSNARPGFLVLGGTHAREWMNPVIVLEFAEQLLRRFDPASTDPKVVAINRIVREGDVFLVPAVNPDGLTYSRRDDAGWRKNRRPNAGACKGVDPNRNFETYFGGAGSSADPCSEAHRGAHAFSEAESRNVRWLLETFPNITVGVDSHSSGQQIFRPGPAGGSFISALPVSPADQATYTMLETKLQAAIAAVNGVVYGTGSTSNHAGTSDEYMFFAHRVFGFNTECGTSFSPPWAEAVPVIAEVVAGLHALAAATLDLGTAPPADSAPPLESSHEGVLLSVAIDAGAEAGHDVWVEPAADRLTIRLAGGAEDPPPMTVSAPSGRVLRLDDYGVRITTAASQAQVEIERPSPGRWRVDAGAPRSQATLTALIHSSLDRAQNA